MSLSWRNRIQIFLAPDKKRSADKIDDMAALLMAVGVSMAAQEQPITELCVVL